MNDSQNGAIFSPDGMYRYRLWRTVVEPSLPGMDTHFGRLAFIMLNPSTAGKRTSDPTMGRVVDFTIRWGFRRVDVGNVLAYCSPNPDDLVKAKDPFGPDNVRHVTEICDQADKIVCAWGAYKPKGDQLPVACILGQMAGFIGRLNRWSEKLYCLGTNQDGSPRHPLYLHALTPLEPFTLTAE